MKPDEELRRAKFLFLAIGLVCAAVAAAADAQLRRVDPTTLPMITWAWVFGIALIGYLASSAEVLFGWLDARGWREFGKIVQGFAGSIAAGFIAYVLGLYADAPPLLVYVGIVPASYYGEAYLRKFAERKAEKDSTGGRP